MKIRNSARPVSTWLLAAGLLAATTPLTAAWGDKTFTAILPPTVEVAGVELSASAIPPSMRGNWQKLVCNDNACELRAIELNFHMQQGAEQLLVNGSPTVQGGQARGEFTIALLQGTGTIEKRIVPTWYTLRRARSVDDDANGSLGLSIRTSAQESYRLIPRWRMNPQDDFLTLYLETRQSRQRLGIISLEAVKSGLAASDILLWAGDLDGDGRIDLITRVGDNGSTRGLHLWLSSLANGNAMVGRAASLDQWTDVDTEGGEGEATEGEQGEEK